MRRLLYLAEHLLTRLMLPLGDFLGHFRRRRPSLTVERGPEAASALQASGHWYSADFPMRQHNRLKPLLHGDEYFADLCRALSTARQRVTIAGWCLTPLISLLRDGREAVQGSILADLLNQVSQRAEVYVLLWSGAPALFEPNTRMVQNACRTLLQIAPRVRCVTDPRASFSHDHHQKAITVDGHIAYIGGMDLTTFQGDRWDTMEHELRFGPNWHDVQMRIEGEAVQDVEQNFCQRWNAVTGENLQPLPVEVDPAWTTQAQVVRTVPAGFYPFAPGGKYGIAHAYLAAIRQAERFIYLENQYLWCPEIVGALIEAMNRPHAGPFRIVLVLPAKAYTGKYDNDAHVRTLLGADRGRGIFHAYSPYASGPAFGATGYRYLPTYVHAKVGVIDDRWLTVGSANLNNRGIATDTEINVQAVDPDLARELRVRLWADHLQLPEAEIAAADPIELIDGAWQQVADRLLTALKSGGVPPGGHALRYMPGSNPGSRALDALQMLTLER